MEFQKAILWGALFLVLFLFWDAWQKDHYQPVTTAASATQAAREQGIPLPESAALATTDKSTLPATPAMRPTRYIVVDTDLLGLKIDLRGGNIIYSEFKRYPENSKKPQRALVLLNNEEASRYWAESGLVSATGPDLLHKEQAEYTTEGATFSLADGKDKLVVTLQWNKDGVVVNKIFTLHRDSYVIDVSYAIANRSPQNWTGHLYTELKRKETEQAGNSFNTFFGAAISSAEKPYEKITFKAMHKQALSRDIENGWAAMLQHYFLSAWIPPAGEKYHYYTRILPGEIYAIGMVSPLLQVASQQSLTVGSKLYVGPTIIQRLAAVAPHLDLTVDYGFLWFISSALFWLMEKMHSFFGNWGWCIIAVTVLIKLLFYRLSATSYRSMARMRNMQPKIQLLKERYGDDRQAMTKATMELYKKEKINPLGGCLPILVQIPVFLGLYWVLLDSVEFRQAPFIGWITDLSIKDPFYVLPLLMGFSMFVQQKMSPPPPDPMQAKVMMLMPVIFTVFFLNFPAGLVLYWLVNNTLSILQQWWITRSIMHAEAQGSSKKAYKNK